MHTFGFILEQGLGHRTHALNLQANVPKDTSVNAFWGLMTHQTTGLTAKLPFYHRYWTVEAGLLARRTIWQMQQQTKMDALFFHTQVTAVLATNWLKRIPSIISLDATPIQYDALGEYYEHRRAPAWLERQKWRLNYNCLQAAQHLVTWSHWAKQSLIDDYGVPSTKITVIPPGISVKEWLRPIPAPATPVVKLLFVGGNLKRKGGVLLLAALRTLRAEAQVGQPTVELHMVTREALAPEPGLFVYQQMEPNSAELRALFQQCDIFCLPTYGDCLPIALIEACAAGLPAITTRVGGTAEVVTHGENGFLIDVGDEAGLVQALRTLIQQPALRLRQSAAATTTARQRFDAEQTTARLLALLKSISKRSYRNEAGRALAPEPGTVDPTLRATVAARL